MLSTEEKLRRDIQVCLAPLEAHSAAFVIDLLLGERGGGLILHRWVRAWSIACILMLLAVVAQLVNPLLIVAILLINASVVFRATPSLYNDLEALRQCKSLLRVADALARIDSARPVPQLAQLAADRSNRSALHRALNWYALSWFLPYVSNLLNFLLLWDLVAFSYTIDGVRAKSREFVRTFELVGSLDATICIACFLAQPRMRIHCLPCVTGEALIDIAEGYHPLLTAPVLNSARLLQRSALVSGSNMAGKTTFIKMLGTNIILGRTIGVCLASRATIPRARVAASIRGEHSIVSGKSRYFSETERVLSFLKRAEATEPQVLVIDELFSGTNTRERVAAAYAVLKALSARAQVLATTHDVELQVLLARGFEMLSFVESPEADGYFDYRVRSGASPIGNAIRLLEKVGFAAAIVQDALAALDEGASGQNARSPRGLPADSGEGQPP
jgi:hypothetical protein